MDSRQSRAVNLMNAARRNHFASRLEKYEAKVRQSKIMSKEYREAKSGINSEPQQPCLSEKVLVPERVVAPAPVVQGKSSDPPVRDPHLGYSQNLPEPEALSHKNVPEMVVMPETTGKIQKQHSAGFVYSEDSPEQKTVTDKKEIIAGTMHKLPPSTMDAILQGFSEMNIDPSHGSQVLEREFPLDMPVPENQGGAYLDVMQQKPPPPAAELEVDIHEVALSLKVRIKSADMHASMQEHAFRCARECLDTFGKHQSKRIAFTLKKDFDKVYGPAWHCIVGTSFGSYVTHSLGGFVYFSLDKVSVLLFKTTVEPVEGL